MKHHQELILKLAQKYSCEWIHSETQAKVACDIHSALEELLTLIGGTWTPGFQPPPITERGLRSELCFCYGWSGSEHKPHEHCMADGKYFLSEYYPDGHWRNYATPDWYIVVGEHPLECRLQ